MSGKIQKTGQMLFLMKPQRGGLLFSASGQAVEKVFLSTSCVSFTKRCVTHTIGKIICQEKILG